MSLRPPSAMETTPSRHAYLPHQLPVQHMAATFQSMPQRPQHQNSQSRQLLPHYQNLDSVDRARQYKSRNKRPCDFCRYKKAACHLETHPPCELCARYQRDCTFLESPAKRRRPNNDSQSESKKSKPERSYKHPSDGSIDVDPNAPGFAGPALASMDMQAGLMPWVESQYGIPANMELGNGSMPYSSMPPDFTFEPAIPDDSLGIEGFEPFPAPSIITDPQRLQVHPRASLGSVSPMSQHSGFPPSLHLPFDSTIGEPSLDRQKSSYSQIVGLSGESDPYLFCKFNYDDYNETTFQPLRIRNMVDGPDDRHHSIPTLFTIQPNESASKAQPREQSDTMDYWRSQVEGMVNEDMGKRLFKLFHKFVQPYYPILASDDGGEGESDGMQDLQDVSPCVLAAVYGHALSFRTWDDQLCLDVHEPSISDALFKIAWKACVPLFHTPNISVVQALLLLVQRRPTNRHVSDTSFKWVMMSTAVSIAQALGLNRDPTDWPIPAWEKRHRKRLAWALYVQDKWLSLNFGRSSHIQADDWDVPLLDPKDLPDTNRLAGEHNEESSTKQHFGKLCELTLIVDDVLRAFFTIRAARELHNSLEATLTKAKPFLEKVNAWYDSLPSGLLPNQSGSGSSATSPNPANRRTKSHELDASGSLQLAYITAKIEIFRAMLRPRIPDTNNNVVNRLRAGALNVAKEIMDFLEGLELEKMEAFWASYSRPNFTIASSFLIHLFATSSTIMDAKECLMLLNAWRNLLRVKSKSCDLLNVALLRLDGIYAARLDRLIKLSPAAHQALNEASLSSK